MSVFILPFGRLRKCVWRCSSPATVDLMGLLQRCETPARAATACTPVICASALRPSRCLGSTRVILANKLLISDKDSRLLKYFLQLWLNDVEPSFATSKSVLSLLPGISFDRAELSSSTENQEINSTTPPSDPKRLKRSFFFLPTRHIQGIHGLHRSSKCACDIRNLVKHSSASRARAQSTSL